MNIVKERRNKKTIKKRKESNDEEEKFDSVVDFPYEDKFDELDKIDRPTNNPQTQIKIEID